MRMILAIAGIGLATAAAAEPSPLGDWARGDGRARVRIEPCAQGLCAINTWIKPGVEGEKIGDKLLISLAGSSASALSGQAWDPQRGLSYSIRLDVGPQTMVTKGCLLAGLICKSMTWSRVGAGD